MEGPSGSSVSSQPFIGRLTRSMLPYKLQKRRETLLAQIKIKTKAKHRSGAAPKDPVRLTSCIFPRPVTVITSHPENKTRYRKDEEKLKKPQQLCALKRLQKHKAEDSEASFPLKLTNPIERIAQGMQDKANDQSSVEDQLNPGEGTSVQPPCLENTEQVDLQVSPSFSSQGVTLPLPLHLLPSYCIQKVTTSDILKQIWKVKKARKRLAEALEADRLARQAENMKEQR
ncbi:methyl-CpG-binding domain protein 3-like 2B [Arvicanthis niloticus]|uniref:methyl-CpG-binding domain protein 3-like 2B n=1 Tax=Arvicanthis niloticus TaxID=61156 RepID=UPI001486C340|nr:methyl-CpG-binding domain protein 3-like 2B [Arvicanthis niloticus]